MGGVRRGVHAAPPENCFTNDTSSCHAISATPFADVHLKTGTGNFSANAVPGSELWTVACPEGVSPCPGVSGMAPQDEFKPLQSGEYTVTYTKVVEGHGTQPCTYPLFVGAPGLRVELTWEHTELDQGVDLDLHVHQPNSTNPWGITPGRPEDCSWSNCTVEKFSPDPDPTAPQWFDDTATPPMPVNWWLDPVEARNTCYYAPRGVGAAWKKQGLGCHNPRLDLDNVKCDVTKTDPNDPDFCAPENINIDFPPTEKWTRIGCITTRTTS